MEWCVLCVVVVVVVVVWDTETVVSNLLTCCCCFILLFQGLGILNAFPLNFPFAYLFFAPFPPVLHHQENHDRKPCIVCWMSSHKKSAVDEWRVEKPMAVFFFWLPQQVQCQLIASGCEREYELMRWSPVSQTAGKHFHFVSPVWDQRGRRTAKEQMDITLHAKITLFSEFFYLFLAASPGHLIHCFNRWAFFKRGWMGEEHRKKERRAKIHDTL